MPTRSTIRAMALSGISIMSVFAMVIAAASISCASGSRATVGTGAAPTIATPDSATLFPATEPTPVIVPPSPAARITLAAVGDVMMDRSVRYRIERSGPSVVFAGVREELRAADITVANLETSIGDVGSPRAKGYTFRSPPAAARALADGGIDVVSLANNHSLDFGPDALRQTMSLLTSSGVIAVGAGPDADSARRAHIVEVGGLRLAFLGFVDVPSEGPGFQRSTWEAGPDRPGVSWADVEGITLAVREAKDHADLVIVMLHSGVEGNTAPSSTQRAYARAAIDAGAALVLGSHPHVLQPVERYGAGVIAYSLGNFVFDGFDGIANTSAIFEAILTADGVESWTMIPVSIVDGLPVVDP